MLRVDHNALSAMIGDIYTAAYDKSAWQRAVENLRQLFHGSKACICRNGPDLSLDDVVSTGDDESFQKKAPEYKGETDQIYSVIAQFAVGQVYRDIEMFRSLRRSQFWHEWMAPQDMYGGLGGKVLASGPSFWFFDVQRGKNQPQFENADVSLFALLAPHVSRSVHINRQLRFNKASQARPGVAIFVVDAAHRIVDMNGAAEAMLAVPDLLRVRGERLSLVDATSGMQFGQFVRNVCRRNEGVVPGTGGDIMVRRADRVTGQVDAFVVSVTPHFDESFLPFSTEPCAIVSLRPVTLALSDHFDDYIRALYGLTPKEARIATLISSGYALKDAAVEAGVAFSTARTYLESIFRKTGTRQQSQLVALLRSS